MPGFFVLFNCIAILCFAACFTPLIARISDSYPVRVGCTCISSLAILMIFVMLGSVLLMPISSELLEYAFGETPYFYIVSFGLIVAASGEPYNQLVYQRQYNFMLVPYYTMILCNLAMSIHLLFAMIVLPM